MSVDDPGADADGDTPLDDLDLDLLAEIADLYADADPVPPGLSERMKMAMTVESLHAEVAELTGPTLVATRAATTETGPQPGTVTFTGQSVSLMLVESDPTSASIDLDGWVSPAGALVEVHRGDLVLSVRSDEHGRFVVGSLPRGSLWFVVWAQEAGPDGPAAVRPLVTPTVEF